MIWINGARPSLGFNQNHHSAGTDAEAEAMTQSMRTRHRGLARNLVALWFMLFFACSFTHARAGDSAVLDDASSVQLAGSGPLHTSAGHAQFDPGSASAESCNALQNSPLNQQLLMLLALAALLGLAGAFDLLPDRHRRLGGIPSLAAITPGLSTPMRKQLHRYNE